MIVRIYTGHDGQTHFEDLPLPAEESHNIALQAGANLVFRCFPADYWSDWHTAPRRQYIFILVGLYRRLARPHRRSSGTAYCRTLALELAPARQHPRCRLSRPTHRALTFNPQHRADDRDAVSGAPGRKSATLLLAAQGRSRGREAIKRREGVRKRAQKICPALQRKTLLSVPLPAFRPPVSCGPR